MSTSSSPDTVDVSVRRTFNAPPERVFDAWLTPRLLGQWMFGPRVRDENVIRLDVDPRVGGRFSMLVDRNGQMIDHVGEYLVVDRPRHLEFTWGVRGESDGDDSRVILRFSATPSGCELHLTHRLPLVWADYASRTEQGWRTMLDALHAVFD
jgi:uncharacterized protein YndB with AHSA1/START domain